LSTETRTALEAAIAAHAADETEYPLLPGSWVVVCETTTFEEMDEEMNSMFIATGNQSVYATTGLLYEALNVR
jgi:ureidoglycolate hydrolase